MFKRIYDHFKKKEKETLRNKNLEIFFDIFRKMSKNEFGGRFIDIGLENVAVAVARVVGGTSPLQ